MKKAILTLGLFSLVVLTSFTTTETKTQNIATETGGDSRGNVGGQGTTSDSNKKLDFASNDTKVGKIIISEYSNNSNVVIGTEKKSDI